MGNSSLYDDDIVTWSEQQSSALKRIASRPELSNAVDWSNVIEEIECLGRSEWKSVESQIRNALRHIIKGYCDGASPSNEAWSIETEGFLDDVRVEYRPSMRQQVDVGRAWERATRDAARDLRRFGVAVAPGLARTSPFTLDDLLDPALTYETAIECLIRQQAEPRNTP